MREITGVDLKKFVKECYNLSRPQGLGHLHFEPGELTDEEAVDLINEDSRTPVSLDYVKGRAVKMTVHKQDGKLFVSDNWYDHSEEDLNTLLERCEIV